MLSSNLFFRWPPRSDNNSEVYPDAFGFFDCNKHINLEHLETFTPIDDLKGGKSISDMVFDQQNERYGILALNWPSGEIDTIADIDSYLRFIDTDGSNLETELKIQEIKMLGLAINPNNSKMVLGSMWTWDYNEEDPFK